MPQPWIQWPCTSWSERLQCHSPQLSCNGGYLYPSVGLEMYSCGQKCTHHGDECHGKFWVLKISLNFPFIHYYKLLSIFSNAHRVKYMHITQLIFSQIFLRKLYFDQMVTISRILAYMWLDIWPLFFGRSNFKRLNWLNCSIHLFLLI